MGLGNASKPRVQRARLSDREYDAYLGEVRDLTNQHIRRLVTARRARAGSLYELMIEGSLSEGKALRPALCVAVCRALGGYTEAALPSAAVLELFHNAFLIHDDVEDASTVRRHGPTLHVQVGAPIAINVGDAMLALALGPLLENTQVVGLGKALRALELVAHMARESAEGQAIELEWIRNAKWDVTEREYVRMVHKKSGWYTFVAPMALGAVIAGADARLERSLRFVATSLGVAFQIQDDLLGLESEAALTGKLRLSDLREGKRTLILIHLLRSVGAGRRDEIIASIVQAMTRRDPPPSWLRAELSALSREVGISSDLRHRLESLASADPLPLHSDDGLLRLVDEMRNTGSMDRARAVARRHATAARRRFERVRPALKDSYHLAFIDRTIEWAWQRAS